MKKARYPSTQAVRVLKDADVSFTVHLYDYVEHGGTRVASEQLELDEHDIIKTVVMEDESRSPVVVLMHGDKEISTKELSRFLNVKRFIPCAPQTVTKHTGYIVGGTSPFGMKNPLPVFLEKTVLESEKIFINGG